MRAKRMGRRAKPKKKFLLLRRGLRVGRRPVMGEKLALRPPLMRDYKSWAALRYENQAVLQPREPLWTKDELTRRQFRLRVRSYNLDARHDRGYAYFIWDRDFETLMGAVNLGHIRRGAAQMGVLGYWLGAHFAGHGRMSEAVALIVGLAFGEHSLHRLEAACMIDNEASIRVLVNNGFKEEGYAANYLKINGVWTDHRLFALSSDDVASDDVASEDVA